MKKVAEGLPSYLFAVVVAAVAYLLSPTAAGGRGLLNAGIALAVGLVALAISKLWLPVLGRIAAAGVKLAVHGLHRWGESVKDETGNDTLWEWFTDQLLVAQQRYAFSIGCIAFLEGEDGRLRCLMVEREFRGFGKEAVLLWPGSRVRGVSEDFEKQIRQIVRADTGCDIELLPTRTAASARFKEALATYHPDDPHLENDLLQPPMFVMQQNRPQTHNVPGHIDLLYLGRVPAKQELRPRAQLLDLNDMDAQQKKYLWPDTRVCIERAAEIYRQMSAADQPAAGATEVPPA